MADKDVYAQTADRHFALKRSGDHAHVATPLSVSKTSFIFAMQGPADVQSDFHFKVSQVLYL